MRWAAIDFETATRSRTSACALGVVVVDEGEVVARQAWLIRPPGNAYDWGNIRVHGIQPGDTERAPGFAEVWSEAMHLCGDRPLVAHNAAFDVGVVRASVAHFGAMMPTVDYACTVSLARRTFPGLPAYRLPVVADHVGAGAELSHHDALSDAVACSSILRACFDACEHDVQTVHELGAALKVKVRPVDADAAVADAPAAAVATA
jgi:DNA polymerase-3 subunit epsilon